MEDPVMTEAVVPYWEMENGELTKLELLPVICRKQENKSISGLPVTGGETVIAERLARLSAPYGVQMKLEDGVIKCSW
jgi:poly-gamma-glutamate synthesis protein (capsule biosynthesis protein)